MRLGIMNEPLWKHLDTPILSSAYWMSQGIDTHTSVALETFQCQLCDRKFQNSSVIYIEPQVPNVIIPHQNILKLHWIKYIQRLIEVGRVTAFFVERFQLQLSIIDVIVPSLLQMPYISELGLCNCIDRDGFLLLAKNLKQNHTLKRLLLNENQIVDVDVANELSHGVKCHPTLQELCISHCGIGTNEHILPLILNGCSNLKILRLNENNISSKNITHIGEFLSSSRLTCLRLDRNLLVDDDAKHLSEALSTNSNLQYLYIKGNDFTDTGKEQLMRAVMDTTSLNSIAESNHECEIVFNESVSTSYINDKYWPRKKKVQYKILLTLYGMNNETPVIQYFNEIPLELIPHVLELIQTELTCLDKHDAPSFSVENEPRQLLTRLYCLLRELPCLYAGETHQLLPDTQMLDSN